MPDRIRIIHLINSFKHGGAEAMLRNLLLRTDRERFDPSVALLIDDRSVAGPVTAAGIPMTVIGMKPGIPDPRGVWRLARHIHQQKPHIVQTWMDHSNLIGGLAAWLGTRTRLVWGIHHSSHVAGISKKTTLLTVSACAKLSSRLPSKIIYCSEKSRRLYELSGFSPGPAVVIPNGFDTCLFKPDPIARSQVRQELGVRDDAPLVGLVARFDPFKDHANFLKAASLLSVRMPEARFVLCGSAITAANAALMRQVIELGLQDRCHLLGQRSDVARIYAAMDVATSSSISEAFPLAVGEAMSCGVPCVATDVGDSELIIGTSGTTVPAQNSPALAEALFSMLSKSQEERTALGARARARICELFDLKTIARRYEKCYSDLVTVASRPPRAVADQAALPLNTARSAKEVKYE